MAQRDYNTQLSPVQRQDIQVQGGTGAHAPLVQPSGQRSAVLEGLGNTFGKLGIQLFQQDIENQYIKGQQARLEGKAWEDVDSNLLTRPFVRGGYQDQDYQLQLAQTQQDINDYIQSDAGASADPSTFQQVLNARMQNVLQSMGTGMSVEGRAQALKASTAFMETATAAHADAYRKWNLQQGIVRSQAGFNAAMQEANDADASGDPDRIAASRTRLLSTWETLGEGLPAEAKRGLQADSIVYAASNGQWQQAQALMQSGKLNDFDFQSLSRINNSISRGMQQAQAGAMMQSSQYRAQFEAGISAGTKSAQEVQDYTSQLQKLGVKGSEIDSIWDKFYRSNAQQNNGIDLVHAIESGDSNTMLKLAGSSKQATDKAYDFYAKNNPNGYASTVGWGIRYGIQNGYVPTGAGQEVSSSVQQIINAAASGTEVNPENLQVANGALEAVAQADAEGNHNAAAALLSSMPQDTADVVSQAISRRKTDKNYTLQQAAADLAAKRQAVDKMSPAQKGVAVAGNKQQLDDALNSVFYNQGVLHNTGRFIKGIAGFNTMTQNPASIGMYKAQLSEEANYLASDPSTMYKYMGDPDKLVQDAQANLSKRTIEVNPDDGWYGNDKSVLVLKRGSTQQSVFGTADQNGYVGQALASLYPPKAKGFSVQFTEADDGTSGGSHEILVQQYDADGNISGSPQVVDKSKVLDYVNTQTNKVQSAQRAAHEGIPVKGASGQSVTVDGINTAGLDPVSVVQWRKGLVKSENVKDTAYKDNGAISVGVGHNTQGAFKEGQKATPEQIKQWFKEDSNRALMAGAQFANRLGVSSPDAVLGLAEMNFQLGTTKMNKFGDTFTAIQNKDWGAFTHAVRNSLWYKQTPVRARKFMKAMRSHFDNLPIGGGYID